MVEENKQVEKELKIIKLIKALANGVGVILFIVMLVSAIQQGGLDRLINLNGHDTVIFVSVLTMFFGIIWAHQKGIAGGIVIVLAYIVMAITMGKIFPDAVLPAFLIIGILHIYAGLMELKLNKHA